MDPFILFDIVDPGVPYPVTRAKPPEEEDLVAFWDVGHHMVESATGSVAELYLGPYVGGWVVGPEVIEEGIGVLPNSPSEEEQPFVHGIIDHRVSETR